MNKLGKTRKAPVSIITDEAVQQYQRLCNHGQDSDEMARIKIERDYSLGRVVSFSKYGTDILMIQYYDIFIKVHHTIVTGIFRQKKLANAFNKKFGRFEVNLKKYNKFNKKHGLETKDEKRV